MSGKDEFGDAVSGGDMSEDYHGCVDDLRDLVEKISHLQTDERRAIQQAIRQYVKIADPIVELISDDEHAAIAAEFKNNEP